jgi:hypothetical protein
VDLATLQRQLLGLIKSSHVPAPEDHPYIHEVAGSDRLALVQEVIAWWRQVGLGRYCVLTSTLLRRRGRFEETVRWFVLSHPLSPFIEELAPAFLEALGTHDDPLVAAVARFEGALHRVKRGDRTRHTVDWQADPDEVLHALLNGLPLDEETWRGGYRTVVSHELPGQYEVLLCPVSSGPRTAS